MKDTKQTEPVLRSLFNSYLFFLFFIIIIIIIIIFKCFWILAFIFQRYIYILINNQNTKTSGSVFDICDGIASLNYW